MKYFLRVLFVLVLSIGVIFGTYYYTNSDKFGRNENSVNLTTVTKAPATEKNSNRTLLASLEKEKFYLYQRKNTIILEHNGKETEFDNWSKMIGAQTPSMYYSDFDSDGEKELIIRAVSELSSNSDKYIYELYILNPDKKGSYNVTLASSDTWSEIFSDMITQEVSQLKNCKKIIQFSMITGNKPIIYNKTTGIAENGYSGYARALQDINGEYLTVDNWSKGIGLYDIDKNNNITVDIEINATYKDTSAVQKVGNIHFELDFNDNNTFNITEKSMIFKADEKYRVSNPKKTSKTKWSYIESNNANNSAMPKDTVIDWIKYSLNYDSAVKEKTVNYSSEETEMKNISKTVLTNTYIELTAKENFSFGTASAGQGEYSVIINEGTNNEYDIAYKASVTKSGNREILKITFDKSYPQSEIKTININYGTK